MKELLDQYATYNVWANQTLIERIKQLDEGLLIKQVPSSFNSIHNTLLHIWNAESVWWQRMKEQETIEFPADTFKGSTPEAIDSLLHQNKLWEDWVIEASQEILEHIFLYKNTKGEEFRQPIYEMILHVFNHGTYHRGQLVNILRQLGIEKIPSTDFIVWSRKK